MVHSSIAIVTKSGQTWPHGHEGPKMLRSSIAIRIKKKPKLAARGHGANNAPFLNCTHDHTFANTCHIAMISSNMHRS